MVTKTILVTVFKKEGQSDQTVYGSYNAVVRTRNGWSVKTQKMYKCKMSEETYYNNSSSREEI